MGGCACSYNNDNQKYDIGFSELQLFSSVEYVGQGPPAVLIEDGKTY